jgi:hypothetical protein
MTMLEITANNSTVKIEGEASIMQLLETFSCITHSVYTVLQGYGLPEDVATGLVAGAAAIGTNGETVEPQLSIKAIVPAKDDD